MSWNIQQLFRQHLQGIIRSLRRRGLAPETAADIAQDTFVRVLAAAPTEGTQRHNPKAYLYRVSNNLRINHQRRERLHSPLSLDEESLGPLADPAPTPEGLAYDRQRLRLTEAALAELPPRTRRAFELHRLGEMTLSEVGEALGLSTTRTWALVREAYRHILLRVDAGGPG